MRSLAAATSLAAAFAASTALASMALVAAALHAGSETTPRAVCFGQSSPAMRKLASPGCRPPCRDVNRRGRSWIRTVAARLCLLPADPRADLLLPFGALTHLRREFLVSPSLVDEVGFTLGEPILKRGVLFAVHPPPVLVPRVVLTRRLGAVRPAVLRERLQPAGVVEGYGYLVVFVVGGERVVTPRARFAHSCGGRGAILLGLWRLRLGVDARGESQAAARVDLRGRVAALVRFARVLELSKPALVLAFDGHRRLSRGRPCRTWRSRPCAGRARRRASRAPRLARFGHRGRGGSRARLRRDSSLRPRARSRALRSCCAPSRAQVSNTPRFLRDGRLQASTSVAVDSSASRFATSAARASGPPARLSIRRRIPPAVQQRREVRVPSTRGRRTHRRCRRRAGGPASGGPWDAGVVIFDRARRRWRAAAARRTTVDGSGPGNSKCGRFVPEWDLKVSPFA